MECDLSLNDNFIGYNNDLSDLNSPNYLLFKSGGLATEAYNEIHRVTELLGLGLHEAINFTACDILYKLYDSGSLGEGENLIAVCAASVSWACREFKLSRTLNEISTVTGVEPKVINKGFLTINKVIGSDEGFLADEYEIIKIGELVPRFCSKLEISFRESKAIRDAVEAAEKFDIWRNRISVLGGVIFMVSQISQTKKKAIRETGTVVDVTENTIKNSVRDMYPYVLEIIPKWYACEEEIIKNIGAIISSWD
ncbi:PREDICTED: plant-specific TFIIB-related protein 2-like [Camelina sativa]|uniref:Plant-specific TFIIB-related protein 2-like n=1 Tax=Camelina sativa TaxID=90675 RepID=A0ABM0WAB4_CAMSA|nr:PREDICTED: plant-specific TFIIB-related protein 2-like [Camelina sativa]